MASRLVIFRSCQAFRTAIHRSRRPSVQAWRTMATSQAPTFHVLQYSYVPDILEKRTPHREQHLTAARTAVEEGKVLLAGALGDPVDGGLFIFQNVTKDDIEAFVKADVYYKNGLITTYKIRPYLVAAGPK